MGYGFMPMAVDLKDVEGILGSKDTALVKSLTVRFKDKIKEIDDIYQHQDVVPLATALRQLVAGEKLKKSWGDVYAYALEMLYLHFGELLDNSAWSGMPSGSEWVKEFEKALKDAGFKDPLVTWLTERGSPIPIPPVDIYPGIGYLLKSEVSKAAKALQSVKLSKLKDKELKESVTQLRDWLAAVAKLDRDLVCYYY